MRGLYIIPEHDRITESMRLAQQYDANFEYQDFFNPALLDDGVRLKEMIEFYKSLDRDRGQDLLHGAFLDVTVHSEDKRIRQVSEQRVQQSLEIAESLGIRGVIFHTNTIPNFRTDYYVKNWLDCNERFWSSMAARYPRLEILMENMFDEQPDLLAKLAERMKEVSNFGICLDYAHACAFGEQIEDWMQKLLLYTRHMHLNDNDLKEDLHLAIGAGKIDWMQFQQFMEMPEGKCSVLAEVRGIEKQEASLEFMRAHRLYPMGG